MKKVFKAGTGTDSEKVLTKCLKSFQSTSKFKADFIVRPSEHQTLTDAVLKSVKNTN